MLGRRGGALVRRRLGAQVAPRGPAAAALGKQAVWRPPCLPHFARGLADPASVSPWLTLFNGTRTSLAHLSQIVPTLQGKDEGFDMHLGTLEPALKSLDSRSASLSGEHLELMRGKLEKLKEDAEQLTKPSMAARLREAATAGKERERIRAQLSDLLVCVTCLLQVQSSQLHHSAFYPALPWPPELDTGVAAQLAETWRDVPPAFRPACLTHDVALLPALEESGAFSHVMLAHGDLKHPAMDPAMEKVNNARLSWLAWYRSRMPAATLDQVAGLWPAPVAPAFSAGGSSEPPYADYATALEEGATALRSRQGGPAREGDSGALEGVVRHALASVPSPQLLASGDGVAFVVSRDGSLTQWCTRGMSQPKVLQGPQGHGHSLAVEIMPEGGWRIMSGGSVVRDCGVFALTPGGERGDIFVIYSDAHANSVASFLDELPESSHVAIVCGPFCRSDPMGYVRSSSALRGALQRFGLAPGPGKYYCGISMGGGIFTRQQHSDEPNCRIEIDPTFIGIAADGADLFCAAPGSLTHYDLETQKWASLRTSKTIGAYSGDDGPIAAADLCMPRGLSMDHADIYWADRENHVVRRLHRETQTVHRVLGVPGKAGCDEDCPPLSTCLRAPEATAIDGDLVFVADTGNGRVICLDLRTQRVSVVYQGEEPNALAAASGQLFVADRALHKIFQVDLQTEALRPVLGTGHQGSSKDSLPPLSTNLNGVSDMAIGHGGELLVADELNHVIRGLQITSSGCQTSGVPQIGAWQSADTPRELPEPADHEKGLALMPYRGASWHGDHQLVAPMHISPALAKSKSKFRVQLVKPESDVFIGLVPGRPPSHGTPLDAHALMSPEWNDSTYVQQLSKMDNAQSVSSWQQALTTFRTWFHKVLHGEQKPAHFHLRSENLLEATVESKYDEEADCKTWTLTELKINGKKRGGSLEPLVVGIDVPVMICLFAFDGQLKLLSKPVLI